MLNRAELIGNLGADPEIRRTPAGHAVCSFSLATSEGWRDRDSGERRERTEWHRVVVWSEGLIKVCEQYLQKGSRVYVDGKIATRKWTDAEGRERYATEIVLQGFNARLLMLDRKGSARGPDSPDDYGSGDRSGANQPIKPTGEFDDEIPF
jgi:single-strand DNA-binding protein